MAIFSNQATLTYNGNSTNSNIAYGEILDVLEATKTAVEGTYTPGTLVTYVVTLRNTGNAALNGLTVSDDLGGYILNGTTVYPLTYEAGSAALFIDGVPQATPVVTAGPPLVISGINIPGSSDAVLVYQARANAYANPEVGGTIDNTVTVTGDCLSAPVTATETVTAAVAPLLTISKSITPSQVVDNDRVTYTFVIQNSGSFPRPLTEEEEKYYLQRATQGDMEARNILIERNLRLVAHCSLPLEDNNAVFNLCCRLCSAYERKAFIDGIQYGAHLMKEL